MSLPPPIYTKGAPPPDDTRPLEQALANDPVLGMCAYGHWGENVGVRWEGSPRMCQSCYEKLKQARHPLGET